MSNFRPINRDTGFLLPPSVDEWLPQRHLARFVVEVIDGLDLSELEKAYRGSGSASYHPAMLLGLLMYGYATKVFSSRALERATYDSVAFRFIAGNEHPDHDTIAAFRKRFIAQIEPLFVEVLKLARAMGMLKLGTVALDGTKVHANASRHSALSYGHAKKIEKQLKGGSASSCCGSPSRPMRRISPTGCRSPRSWSVGSCAWRPLPRRRRRSRRGRGALGARAGRASSQARRARRAREAHRQEAARPPARTPNRRGGREQDQVNLTDEDSRIMPVAGGGFDQSYNAQAAVATGSLLIVANAGHAGGERQRAARADDREASRRCPKSWVAPNGCSPTAGI